MGTKDADDWRSRLNDCFGVIADGGFGVPTVDVSAQEWAQSLRTARDDLGCGFFDYLTAVDGDDKADGVWVVAHVATVRPGDVHSVLLRTWLPEPHLVVGCVCSVYAGAAWHERETHEMFGVGFTGHEGLTRLLLPPKFAGHPLRKSYVLPARISTGWPGTKEPGELDATMAPHRRRPQPLGVPASKNPANNQGLETDDA